MFGETAYYISPEGNVEQRMVGADHDVGGANSFFAEAHKSGPIRLLLATPVLEVARQSVAGFKNDAKLRDKMMKYLSLHTEGDQVALSFSLPRQTPSGVMSWTAIDRTGRIKHLPFAYEAPAFCAGGWPVFALGHALASSVPSRGQKDTIRVVMLVSPSQSHYILCRGEEVVECVAFDHPAEFARDTAWRTMLEEKLPAVSGPETPIIVASPDMDWLRRDSTIWSAFLTRENVVTRDAIGIAQALASLPADGPENLLYDPRERQAKVCFQAALAASALALIAAGGFGWKAFSTAAQTPVLVQQCNAKQAALNERMDAVAALQRETEQFEAGVINRQSDGAVGAARLIAAIGEHLPENAVVGSLKISDRTFLAEMLWFPQPTTQAPGSPMATPGSKEGVEEDPAAMVAARLRTARLSKAIPGVIVMSPSPGQVSVAEGAQVIARFAQELTRAGFAASVIPTTGNTTDKLYPNSIIVSGRLN